MASDMQVVSDYFAVSETLKVDPKPRYDIRCKYFPSAILEFAILENISFPPPHVEPPPVHLTSTISFGIIFVNITCKARRRYVSTVY